MAAHIFEDSKAESQRTPEWLGTSGDHVVQPPMLIQFHLEQVAQGHVQVFLSISRKRLSEKFCLFLSAWVLWYWGVSVTPELASPSS